MELGYICDSIIWCVGIPVGGKVVVIEAMYRRDDQQSQPTSMYIAIAQACLVLTGWAEVGHAVNSFIQIWS